MYNNVMPLLIMTPGPPCSGNVDPLGSRLSGLAALSATETRDKWRGCHGPESRTPARSRSPSLTSSLAHTHLHTEGWSQGQAVSQRITPEIWSTLVFVWAGSHTGAVSIFQTSLGSARHSDPDHPLDLWVLQLQYFLEHMMKFMSRLI